MGIGSRVGKFGLVYMDEFTVRLFDRLNMGECRDIPRQDIHGVKVHRSVKLRMEAQRKRKGDPYQPRPYASNLHGSIDSKEACLFSVFLLCTPAL